MHIQDIRVYSRIFRDIDANSATFIGTQLGERGQTSPSLFENRKKYTDFFKKGPDCFHLWVKLFI